MDGMSDSDIIKDALDVFRRCEEVEADNRRAWEEDVSFGRNDEPNWSDDYDRTVRLYYFRTA